jgi:hypothetical protein
MEDENTTSSGRANVMNGTTQPQQAQEIPHEKEQQQERASASAPQEGIEPEYLSTMESLLDSISNSDLAWEMPLHTASTYEEKERMRLHLFNDHHVPSRKQQENNLHNTYWENNAFNDRVLEQQQREFERRRIRSFDARANDRRHSV